MHEIFSRLNRHRKTVGTVALGHSLKKFEEYLFDWLLYGAVVTWATATYGAVWGYGVAFLVLAPISAFISYLYVRVYDWSKTDWLGIEKIEEIRNQETRHWLRKHLRWILTKGDLPMFVALSVYGDPFIVTIYFRKGSHLYNGLSSRDWIIFWSGVLFSNAYWTLRWALIVAVSRAVWTFFTQSTL